MTVVVGFDPSLSCSGVAMVEFGPVLDGCSPVEWQTWRARWRNGTPTTIAGERRRIRSQLAQMLEHVPAKVDLSVVEATAPNAKHSGKADERGGLRWMLIDQLLSRGPVALIDPSTRALLATGHGSRSKIGGDKKVVLAMVRSRFAGVQIPDDNVADAVALAEAGAAQFGLPVTYVQAQISAHAKVAWPVEGELVLAGMRN